MAEVKHDATRLVSPNPFYKSISRNFELIMFNGDVKCVCIAADSYAVCRRPARDLVPFHNWPALASYERSRHMLAPGVGLTVVAGFRPALFNGMRRIGDLTRVSLLSAKLVTITGGPVLLHWRGQGALVCLLLPLISVLLIGHCFISCLPDVGDMPVAWGDLHREWSSPGRLGLPMQSVAGVISGVLLSGVFGRMALIRFSYFMRAVESAGVADAVRRVLKRVRWNKK